MRKRSKRTLLAALSCALVLASLLGIPAAAAAEKTEADGLTVGGWNSAGFVKDTANVGRIWTDKSVSTGEINLHTDENGGQTGGQSLRKHRTNATIRIIQ